MLPYIFFRFRPWKIPDGNLKITSKDADQKADYF